MTTALALVLLAGPVLVACSSGGRRPVVSLADVELPPGLERYEGGYETTLDFAAGLATQSQPDTRPSDVEYFVGSAGRWHVKTDQGDQYLSWGTIPFSTGDGNFYHLFALYLTQPG